MKNNPAENGIPSEITRKSFIKLSLATASSLALSQPTGCAGLPDMRAPKIDYSKGLVLTKCNIIDVISGKVLKNRSLVLRNGRIVLISDTNENRHQSAPVIDLNNKYLMPGLIDGHCHTTLPSIGGMSVFSMTTVMNQMKRNYVQQIRSGITTVRDMSGFPNYLLDNIEIIENGDLTGPRVVHCGSWINVYGSHPGDIPPTDVSIFAPIVFLIAGKLSSNFRDTEELKEMLQDNLDINASFIKLTLDDESVLCGKEDKNTIYGDEHIREIVKFSERHDLPMAAHVHYKSGYDWAQEIPIHHLEHLVGNGPLSDSDIMKMEKNDMTIVPTMLVGQIYAAKESYDEMPPEFHSDFIENEVKIGREFALSYQDRYVLREIWEANRENLKAYKDYACSDLFKIKKFLPKPYIYYGILKHGVESLLKMRDAGILIGCGTDAGVPFNYHGTLWREMEIYSRIGFSNEEILRCATINNARILRMEDRIGSIETGKFGDLAVFSENPLEKIEALRDPVLVLKGGKMVYSRDSVKIEDDVTRI